MNHKITLKRILGMYCVIPFFWHHFCVIVLLISSLFYQKIASSCALTKNNIITDIFLTIVTEKGNRKITEHFHVLKKSKKKDM